MNIKGIEEVLSALTPKNKNQFGVWCAEQVATLGEAYGLPQMLNDAVKGASVERRFLIRRTVSEVISDMIRHNEDEAVMSAASATEAALSGDPLRAAKRMIEAAAECAEAIFGEHAYDESVVSSLERIEEKLNQLRFS